ncbi:MAG: hypothetical protein ACQERD_01450 [Campylobacterota bacterium]
MIKTNKYTFTKFSIPNQKNLYHHKEKLLDFGLYFNSKNQEYINRYELSITTRSELLEYINNNELIFKQEDIHLDDIESKIASLYTISPIDKNTFAIKNRRNDKKVIIIAIYESMETNIINILDVVHGEYFKIKKSVSKNSSNYLLEVFKILNDNAEKYKKDFPAFDIPNLLQILGILLVDYDKDYSHQAMVKKFKFATINKIGKKNQKVFLCNCVKGFFCETNFYLLNEKIISDFSNNPINYSQEMKVWKYLYSNKQYVAKRKEPNLYELFVNQKIPLIFPDGYETKVLIKSVKNRNNGIEVTVFDGVKNQKINRLFSKDELLDKIKAAR